MSDDLIKRLRDWSKHDEDLCYEAAEYIKQLERERDEFREAAKTWQEDFIQENQRLHVANVKLAKAVEALRYYALEPNPWDTDNSLVARTTLTELEVKE